MIKAERVDFQIAPGVFIEFYRLPSGEKRIGTTSAAIVCGLRRAFFSEFQKLSDKDLKALQGKGFKGFQTEVSCSRLRGSSKAKTISLDDFRALVRFAAADKNKKPATALLDAFFGVALETVARQAFGEEALTLGEIRKAICKEYAKTVDWLEEDREDGKVIDAHMLFLKAV